MNNILPTYIIIVAGGQGLRMGTAIPKQFLPLNGKPVLYYSISAFAKALPPAHFILVLPQHQISYAQTVLQSFSERMDITIVAGGETRFDSVKNGLSAIEENGESIIMVHDGVRPLISSKLILRCYHQAIDKGSAIPAIAVSDSIRIIEEENSQPINRDKMRAIQTPQTFRSSVLIPAFEQAYKEQFTDEANVVEAYGTKIFLTEGERSNIKITLPEDIIIAEALMNNSERS